jgi:hypothetical protein
VSGSLLIDAHEAVFLDVYKRSLWGKQIAPFDSGPGADPKASCKYVEFVRAYVQAHNIRSITDLGCGDFRISHAVLKGLDLQYEGMDVVGDLIDQNKKEHSSDLVRFTHGNFVTGPLPAADLCIVKQIFQHLSNEDIQCVMPKLTQYKHCLITDEISRGPKRNDNKTSDDTIRKNGLFLEAAPFYLNLETMLVTDLDPWLIRTVRLVKS